MKFKRILISALLSFSVVSAAFAASTKVKIDRIVVRGVKAFPLATIESTLEVYPGQNLDRHSILVSEQNMQAFYRAHGFEEMSVKASLTKAEKNSISSEREYETILQLDVSEGRPIRVAEVALRQVGTVTQESEELWRGQLSQLKKVVSLAGGDVLDQAKIAESRRAIQETLLSKDFIGAGVAQVVFEPVSDSSREESARWVKVQFEVDLGDRVSFGFRGNQFFSWSALETIVSDLRATGLGKDYLEVIRRRVEEEYRSAGFSKVTVSPYTVEEPHLKRRRVVFAVEEGPRVRIESIDFDGNLRFSSEKLRERFFSKATAVIQNGFYVEKDVQKTAELVIEWMKERGFLSSRLVTIQAAYPPMPKTQAGQAVVRLVIYIYEGNETRLGEVRFDGLTKISADEAQALLGVKEGQALNIFALTEGIETLKHFYKDQGYLSFEILNQGKDDLVRYSQDNRQADVFLELKEGPQYRVGKIQLEGLRSTEAGILFRELTFKKGDVLGESSMTASERQLRKLGIFSSVVVRALDGDDESAEKTVLVRVEEADRGTIVWGPGIRNDLGLRIFGQLTYVDLWGKNHTISVNAAANRRFFLYNFGEGQIGVNYTWPWFIFPGVTFRPSVNFGRNQYLDFTANQIKTSFAADNASFSLLWDKQILSQPSLLGSFSYNFEGISQFMASRSIDQGEMTIGSVTPRLTLDLRDNSLVPTSGFYSTAWFDYAPPFLGTTSQNGKIGFYRAQIRADYHIPLPKKIGLYLSFRTGYEKSLTATTDPSFSTIPLIKQFALGGVGSLRGYNELELNTLTSQLLQGRGSNVIQDSLSYINYRAQIDLPVSANLKVDFFLDSANLLISDYGFKYMLYGSGFGLRYVTPVGSVNVDWGYKLNPPPGSTDRWVLHFSVGVI